MNTKFCVEVYNHSDVTDAPVRLRVEISPARANEIRRLATLVGEHKNSLWVHTITAWDHSPEWINSAYDSNGNETDDDGDEQSMDCGEIVVTEDAFYYQALVRDCDVFCFSDRIPLTKLPGQTATGETEFPDGS
jgi:hypothetical protein